MAIDPHAHGAVQQRATARLEHKRPIRQAIAEAMRHLETLNAELTILGDTSGAGFNVIRTANDIGVVASQILHHALGLSELLTDQRLQRECPHDWSACHLCKKIEHDDYLRDDAIERDDDDKPLKVCESCMTEHHYGQCDLCDRYTDAIACIPGPDAEFETDGPTVCLACRD